MPPTPESPRDSSVVDPSEQGPHLTIREAIARLKTSRFLEEGGQSALLDFRSVRQHVQAMKSARARPDDGVAFLGEVGKQFPLEVLQIRALLDPHFPSSLLVEYPEGERAFQKIRQRGEGGMGIVYKAWDPSSEEYVAIKTMREAHESKPKFRKRFEREAILNKWLSGNEQFIRFVGSWTTDNHSYMATEYIEGPDLQNVLHRGTYNALTMARIMQDIAHGLSVLFQEGIAHRDLKPGNVLLTASPEKESEALRAKIIDLGLARVYDNETLRNKLREEPGDDDRLSQDLGATTTGNEILGSIPYMSPEQARGDTRSVDSRSDMYTFVLILLKWITGMIPLLMDNFAKTSEARNTFNIQMPRRECIRIGIAESLKSDFQRKLKPIVKGYGTRKVKWRTKSPQNLVIGMEEIVEFLRKYQDELETVTNRVAGGEAEIATGPIQAHNWWQKTQSVLFPK